MLRESGTVYRRNAGTVSQVAPGRPRKKRMPKYVKVIERKVVMTSIKDDGCSLSPSCLNCKKAEICQDCTEPASSCLVCKVPMRCPLFKSQYED